MPASRSVGTSEILIGPFEVVADADAVAAFAAAAGAPAGTMPATFPATWLGLPQVRQALTAAVGPDHLPDRLVIEAQAVGLDGSKTVAIHSVLRIVAIGGDTAR